MRQVKHFVPNPQDNFRHPLLRSTIKEFKENVYNDKGEIVRTKTIRKGVYVEISSAELQNVGIRYDFFLIPELERAGVSTQLVDKPMFGLSLDDRSQIEDELNSFDPSSLSSDSSNQVINFENN